MFFCFLKCKVDGVEVENIFFYIKYNRDVGLKMEK